ncbi:MAG: hypothetical protein KAG19_08465 [Methylococcales bacterium]|nr:hypothetical protein [Methylococcales bacterium]
MAHRTRCLIPLIACLSFVPTSLTLINSAHAEQKKPVSTIQGKVIDVIDVTSYTYVEIETGDSTVWAAAPTTQIKIGTPITVSTQMPMRDFHSDSINKTFPLIYFVGRFTPSTDKAASAKSNDHTKIKSTGQILKGIKKIDGGKTIAEIYTEKDSLKGKSVKIRAQVTHFSAEIMGKNWLHIQDSSTAEDLTVTTKETVTAGDIVILEGTLATDKDFTHGYVYSAILENAVIIKEK